MNNFLEGASLQVIEKNGTPEWIRTTDLLLRRQTLYPAELRAHTDSSISVANRDSARGLSRSVAGS